MKTGTKLFRISLLILILGLTSCVDILNELNINADKSGTAFVGIKVNAISSLINLSGDYLDKEVKNSIISFPSQAASDLSTIAGIHNIKTYSKLALGKIGVEFEFDKPSALNKAYYKLLGKDKKWYYPNIIKIKNHKVKSLNITPFIKHYFDNNESMLTESDLLKYLKYTTIISMPKAIRDGSFEKGNLSKDKKVISYSIPMKRILEESVSTENSFRY